jgi:hypothetical protein
MSEQQEPPGASGDEQDEGFQPIREGEQVPGVGEMAGMPHLAGSAQAVCSPEVSVGMEVVGSDGVHVGQVKAVQEHSILVDRPMQRDLVVPCKALFLLDEQVVLGVPADQADAQGWGPSSIM